MLLALRSRYYKTPWQQICVYLLAPTHIECVSPSSVKFQKCWHFSIEYKCWLVHVDTVMILCFTLLSLPLCRACGFGAFICWDRPVWKQEIPALKSTFLEPVKANALCTALTKILMWDDGLFKVSPVFLFSPPVGTFTPGYVHCESNLSYISQVLSLSVFGGTPLRGLSKNYLCNFCSVP